MKISFCFWGIKPNSAVSVAWIRLVKLFQNQKNIDESLFFRKSLLHEIKNSRNNTDSESYFVCANIWQVLLVKFLLIGSRVKIIYWIQGLVAEESYLRNQSKIRFNLLLLMEYIALRSSFAYIYVSSYMKNFYENRYNFTSEKKYLILPCISDLNLNEEETRSKNSFCYLGGMAKWQRFDLIVEIMNEIIKENPTSFFNVATKDTLACNKILVELGSEKLIQSTKVESLYTKSDIERFLSRNEFGFLIRDDNPINNVSSPIKLAEYLSCGVNVISTNAIKSYTSIIQEAGHIIDPSNLEKTKLNFSYLGKAASLIAHHNNFSQQSASVLVSQFLIELSS